MNRLVVPLLTAFVTAWSAPLHAGDIGHESIGTAALRPVAVIDREDIALSGRETLLDLIDKSSTTSFRGLGRVLAAGPSRMVLLINGRRAGPMRDLDTIPLSMVERIEILDGSAVGALAGHAASGAVNVVLREDPEGVEMRASGGLPTAKGGWSRSGSALWHGSIGSGRMTLGVDTFRRAESGPRIGITPAPPGRRAAASRTPWA